MWLIPDQIKSKQCHFDVPRFSASLMEMLRLQVSPGMMPEQALALTSAFMDDIHHGNSLCNTKNPSNKTIRGYMTSAVEAWKALTGMTVPLYEDTKDG
jgi:hypothetical protein